MMALCAGLLVACDKEEEYEPVKPPVEQPEEPNEPDKPVTPPSTDDIINVKIGDLNMIVGIDDWNDIAYGMVSMLQLVYIVKLLHPRMVIIGLHKQWANIKSGNTLHTGMESL